MILNESEAEFLCGSPVDSLERAAQAAESLRRRGPGAVLITLGSQGVCVACGGPPTHIPAFTVSAVDATAAGDVFCGALAASLVEDRPLLEAVRFANAAAAICVTRSAHNRRSRCARRPSGSYAKGRKSGFTLRGSPDRRPARFGVRWLGTALDFQLAE